AALVDLITARLADAYSWVPTRPFIAERDMYPWCKVAEGLNLEPFDTYGLRTLLTGVRFFLRMSQVSLSSRSPFRRRNSPPTRRRGSPRGRSARPGASRCGEPLPSQDRSRAASRPRRPRSR